MSKYMTVSGKIASPRKTKKVVSNLHISGENFLRMSKSTSINMKNHQSSPVGMLGINSYTLETQKKYINNI